MAEEQTKHKRRPHYSGRYPKKFSEKYKEQNPEKYADTVQHVIEKGNTPAGMHIPIMVPEILQVLSITPGESGIDCTLGYGGHSRKLLDALQGQGHLCSLDADPIEIGKTTARMRAEGYGEELFTPLHLNFRDIDQACEKYGPFDFLLADLGVSSMQIDNPERGFSFRADGPLDLRFDPEKGKSAAEVLAGLDVEEMTALFVENADEPCAREIARAINRRRRSHGPITTTTALRETIEGALDFLPKAERKEAARKSCARVFQALRIEVNSEFEVLEIFLEKLPSVLAPGGRAAILTFHSGEDRLVKKALQAGQREGLYSAVARDVTRPSREECYQNPRARSTKLRWAVRAQ